MSDENVKYPTPVVVGVTKNEVPRGAYRFLTDDDVLCKGDLVRDTYLLADLSGSDFHDPKSSILVNWRLVDDVMPYWIGARLGDFNEGPDPEQPRKFPCEAIRAALSGEGTGGDDFKTHVVKVLSDVLSELRIGRDSTKGSLAEQVAYELRRAAVPPEGSEERRDAERWRALFVEGGRVQLLGSAGLGHADEPQHIGFDLWDTYPPDAYPDADSRKALTLYADTIIARRSPSSAPSEQGGTET